MSMDLPYHSPTCNAGPLIHARLFISRRLSLYILKECIDNYMASNNIVDETKASEEANNRWNCQLLDFKTPVSPRKCQGWGERKEAE